MAKTLIGAIETLMSLQRWNVMPRVENWSEGENIAFTTHVVYSLGRQLNWNDEKLEHGILRSLFKSFNKHYLADIPVKSRAVLKQISDSENPDAYPKLINETAKISAKLFPRSLVKYFEQYMTLYGDYEITGGESEKKEIEELISFSQNKVALDECETNLKVYPNRGYEEIKADIERKIGLLVRHEEFNKEYNEILGYLGAIKNLKYLRRWNRINRTVESSVLSHTFVVTLLSILFSNMAKDTDFAPVDPRFVFHSMLRAMFHDFPESLTGDIITPVKEILNSSSPGIWDKVELILLNSFKNEYVPRGIKEDIKTLELFQDLSDSENYSVSSMVKDCDRLALILECHLEFENGNKNKEMLGAYKDYIGLLKNSEWAYIREFSLRMSIE